MVVKKRRGAYHHPDLRRALIDAAVDLIGKHGAQALTLREVARRAGVTHGAPYRHFPDREALIAAVAEEGFHALGKLMATRMRPAVGDWPAAITACGVAYVEYATKHPAHFQVMFTAELQGKHPSMEAASQQSFALLRDTVSGGQRDGTFLSAGDPDPAALAAWSVVHGLASLLVARRVPAPPRIAELATHTIELCLRGLVAVPREPERQADLSVPARRARRASAGRP
ncbi:MAG: TetR/AcrR family transcriptional regulator [Archangium sp.]